MNATANNPKFSLTGLDGNAFCIMAYVSEAMRKSGVQPACRNEYVKQATGGDYDNLVTVSQGILDKLNANIPIQ